MDVRQLTWQTLQVCVFLLRTCALNHRHKVKENSSNTYKQHLLQSRMPGETIRDRSAVGRFPSVTLGILNDAEGEKAEPEESETQNACRRWLRKFCPCCQPKPDDDSEDALVAANDGDDKEGEATAEKPGPGDSELEGTRSP